MFRLLRFLFTVLVVGVGFFAGTFYILPVLLERLPPLCAVRHLTTGICSTTTRQGIDNFSQRIHAWVSPHVQSLDLEGAVKGASVAADTVQQTVRDKAGDAAVDGALKTLQQSLLVLQTSLHTTSAQEKLTAIPGNAQKLLEEVRTSLGQLQSLLAHTKQRADDVSTVVTQTKQTLDALSSVLPPPSPTPQN